MGENRMGRLAGGRGPEQGRALVGVRPLIWDPGQKYHPDLQGKLGTKLPALAKPALVRGSF